MTLRDCLLILAGYAVLLVSLLAFEEWKKYLRDRLRAEVKDDGPKWRKASRRRTRIGIRVTVWWLVLFGAISFASGLPHGASEWGDWAAGAFAPVAFGWLVLGYFQQGEELRIQASELNASVEQQRSLSEASRRQAALLSKATAIKLREQLLSHQPRFVNFTVAASDPVARTLQIAITNIGAPCTETEIQFWPGNKPGCVLAAAPGMRKWETGATHQARLHVETGDVTSQWIVRYQDDLMVNQDQRFRVYCPAWPKIGDTLPTDMDRFTHRFPLLPDDLRGDD